MPAMRAATSGWIRRRRGASASAAQATSLNASSSETSTRGEMRDDNILDLVTEAKTRLTATLLDVEHRRSHPLITKEGVRLGNVVAEASRVAVDDPWKWKVYLILEEST